MAATRRTMQNNPAPVPGETVDWSFVVDGGCPECGYEPHKTEETSARTAAAALRWQAVLERSDAAERPEPGVWSPVEYACHVRDMLRLLEERVELMLTGENPLFGNWDQDKVAVEAGYYWADPAVVAADLSARAISATTLSGIDGVRWDRTGRRSDGIIFTVASLCRFTLHDAEHHLQDVHG